MHNVAPQTQGHDREAEGDGEEAGSPHGPAHVPPLREEVEDRGADVDDVGEEDGPQDGEDVAKVGEDDGDDGADGHARHLERLFDTPGEVLARAAEEAGEVQSGWYLDIEAAHSVAIPHHVKDLGDGEVLEGVAEGDDHAKEALDKGPTHALRVERDDRLGVRAVEPVAHGTKHNHHHGNGRHRAVVDELKVLRVAHRVLDEEDGRDALEREDGDAHEDGERLLAEAVVHLAKVGYVAVLVAHRGVCETIGYDEHEGGDHGDLRHVEEGREARHVLDLDQDDEDDAPADSHEKVRRVVRVLSQVVVGENLLEDSGGGDGEEDSVGDAVADLAHDEDNVCEDEPRGPPQRVRHVGEGNDAAVARLLEVPLCRHQEFGGEACDERVEDEEGLAHKDAAVAECEGHAEDRDADAALEEDHAGLERSNLYFRVLLLLQHLRDAHVRLLVSPAFLVGRPDGAPPSRRGLPVFIPSPAVILPI
mmetsp:Transcript_5302/g.13540  ORF Transcript_5302/g.13540 Transcript_5302/m.13540 type:complete len:477 (+) Transcript_5302:287-1717(+)